MSFVSSTNVLFSRIFSLILFSDDHFLKKFNNELHTDDRQREKEIGRLGEGGEGGKGGGYGDREGEGGIRSGGVGG